MSPCFHQWGASDAPRRGGPAPLGMTVLGCVCGGVACDSHRLSQPGRDTGSWRPLPGGSAIRSKIKDNAVW